MFVVFFKQKTAYEMRISDWSSDVCSSDLFMKTARRLPGSLATLSLAVLALGLAAGPRVGGVAMAQEAEPESIGTFGNWQAVTFEEIGRASCGKECVSTCSSRWSPYQ